MTVVTASRTAAWDELRAALPGVEIITDPLALVTYEVDAGVDRGRPDAVAFPRSTGDVVRLVRWAHERGIPIVARGAGTGLSGGAVAEQGGLVLCFARMKRILELDPGQRMALVEPGVVNIVLNNAARAQGLVFPPDPSSGLSATLGGNIAENAGGPHCAKYGVTTNYVTGLQVVTADGQVVCLGGPAADYPEYDFLGVMTGNEGTLGIITEARLRLIRDTTNFKTLLAAFTNMEAACEAVSAIIAAGLVPAALEIVDHVLLNIIEAYAHAGLPVEAAACLVAEVDGYAAGLDSQMDEIVALLQAHGGYNLVVAQTAEQRAQIWKARKSVGGAVARIAPAYISLDATVPRSRLAQALAEMNAICADAGVRVGYVAHAGDGNFHPHLFIDDPSDQALLRHIHETGYHMMAACVAMGGSITGEHGVGIEKRDYLGLMFGPAEMAAMQDLKAVCDPDGLLNPGKIFPEVAPAAPQTSEPGRPPEGHYAPASTAEAAEALRAWAAAAPPGGVLIYGGGTKSPPLPGTGAVLSTTQLSDITEYAPEDLYVRVGAGMSLMQLQARLARDGMWAPLVSPWPGATIGGILAANFNAPLRMRYGYGSIRDQVLEATIVLPGGQALRAGRPLVKNVAGYDVTKLFIGSYGTLGLIADVTLKLAPLPRARATLAFPVEDAAQGQGWAGTLLRIGLVSSALLLCRGCDVGGVTAPLALTFTAEGWPEDVAAELAAVRQALANAAPPPLEAERPGSEFWASWLYETEPDDVLLRVGVAAKDVPAIAGSPYLAGAGWLADMASGLVYVRSVSDVAGLQGLARSLGGYACLLRAQRAERAPAGSTAPADRWGYRPDGLALMAALKRRWDPQGYLNPGVFLV